MARHFSGIIPPLVTPLTDRDQLDHAGLERLVERVVAGGVQGLFILGTTGEAPSLSYRLRRELVDSCCRLVAGRVPVLVGITDTSFVESIALARHAEAAGASALVVSTPYYFPAGQTELAAYIEHLVAELPLPLMLYNMPSLTKVWFELPTLQRLVECPRIVGLKDSSGDLDYFGRLMALRTMRPEWSFMIGPEALLPAAMRLGGDGGVAGGANVFPRLFTSCYESVLNHDDASLALAESAIAVWQRAYEVGKYASRHIKATKCALSLLGVCDDFLAEPFHRFKPPDRERVAQVLADSVLQEWT